ncbi:hypothetical protein V495_05750 [Pseudogymnoascus sp. VKM F-4514 (FW-929)]|nr:hypothetical protein V495_05750 [Pseudogymnoascus sp. VKM F-4514 (FW-929)]
MPPKQATLGRFFGGPNGNGVKPAPPKQTTLAFSSKSTNESKAKTPDVKDEEAEDEDLSNEVHTPKNDDDAVKEQLASEVKASPSPNGKDSKKRIRDEILADSKNEAAASDESKKPKEEQEEDDEEPVLKRPRRNGKESTVSKDASETKPNKKGKDNAAGKGIKKEVVEIEDDAPLVKPERKASATPEENSEVEEDIEEDEEDEKPEVAAKTREKIQTTLKSNSKDPYPDWKPGEPVPYAALCTTFSLIEMTTKRLIIAAHCSLFLRQVLRLTPDDLLPTVLLMINKLAADYAGIELGIGESLIMKAIGEATGRSLAVIKQDQKEIGDLGLVAVKSRSNQPTMYKPKPLTVRGIHKALLNIAIMQGNGAQGRKVDGIKKLLSAADSGGGKVDLTKDKGGPSEAKFIIRFLEGKLRLGLAEKTVLVSLAQAMVCHETESKGRDKVPSTDQLAKGEQILKAVYSELPSYDVIIPAMVEHGIFNLRENCKLQPGVPLKPMLAKPTKAITEVLDRFENQTFTCEYKYDGERAQIHYVSKDAETKYASSVPAAAKGTAGGLAAIFSRNSEDLSKKYPDILEKLGTWVKPETKSFVLDCETVAWDMVEKKVLPFQQLMTRKKKDVKTEDVKVKPTKKPSLAISPPSLYTTPMSRAGKRAVVEKPLRERRELLHTAFAPVEGEFAFATSMNGQEIDEIQTFLDDSVKASCEGLMVKMLDGVESGYEPSKRSRNWLKIKKDYLAGIGDSLDLVVLGAYHGKGKRTSVYGAFLLACYNPSTERYETVCNIGTGFSEEVLESLHAQLADTVIDRPKPFYEHSKVNAHQPDVWFEPRFVWEVRTADLTLSPKYRAGYKEGIDANAEKGVSLRFPRFIKIRDDKKVDEATSSRQIAEMYRRQESVSKGPAADDDFEY